jgi:hypothetical protein
MLIPFLSLRWGMNNKTVLVMWEERDCGETEVCVM